MRSAAFIATIAIGVPVLLSGCGSSDDPKNDNQVAGKVQFVKNCGSCHILSRAGTKGTTGPNLDQAFQQSLKDGFGRDAIEGLVQQQILYPNQNGVMPAKIVEGETASDIASYVADAVAAKGKDTGLLADAVKPAGAGQPIAAKNGVLATEADPNGQLAYVADKATAPPGPLQVTFKNTSGVAHDIAFQQGTSGPEIASTEVITKGEDKTSLTVAAGSYTFFCTVPGHRAAGMVGTLTVK